MARCSGLDRLEELLSFPIEGVDFLGAGVAEKEGGVIGRETQPDTEEAGLAEVFQVGDAFDFVVAEADPHYCGIVFLVQEVNVVVVLRPVGEAQGYLRNLFPFLSGKIEKHEGA
jgi:hypothetical protein